MEILHPCWQKHLKAELEKAYMVDLKKFIHTERAQHIVYPPEHLIFNAINTTPLNKVKVIILGQDPYHGPKQAHGLSFSVPVGTAIPPSLRNIYKELAQSLDFQIPSHGNLSAWAKQGVLLLNTTLTVRSGEPKSHAGHGWETFTDAIISILNSQRENLIFLLWGSHAQKKQPLINNKKHHILKTTHPSPLSAYRGFLGCNHFAMVNNLLLEMGSQPIDWQLN